MMRVVGSHRQIVSLVDVFDTEDAYALVLDLTTGGDLIDQISALGHYSERDAAAVVRQVALALRHIHRCGVVHCDLKPSNLLCAGSPAHGVQQAVADRLPARFRSFVTLSHIDVKVCATLDGQAHDGPDLT